MATRHRFVVSGGLFTAAALTMAIACSESDPAKDSSLSAPAQSETQSSGEPLEIAERLARYRADEPLFSATPRVGLRQHGELLVPVSRNESTAFDIGLSLSARANGKWSAHPIASNIHGLVLQSAQATDTPAELDDKGRAVFKRAFGSADLIASATPNRLQQTIVIRDENSPDLFVWKYELGAEMRAQPLDDGSVALLDREGMVRLTVEAAELIDAKGRRSASAFEFHEDGFARLPITHRDISYPALVNFALLAPPMNLLAAPPTQIKARVMIVLDTSGSMVWRFQDSTSANCDGASGSLYCDNSIGTGFTCSSNQACTSANGLARFPCSGTQSRMAASKAAITNVINANAGLMDFGLERFRENTSYIECSRDWHCQSGNCKNNDRCACSSDAHCPLGYSCTGGECLSRCTAGDYCCTPQSNGSTPGRCQPQDEYPRITSNSSINLTYSGSCGTLNEGARILVPPGPTSGQALLRWVDSVEDFCSSTGSAGGAPRNPELRASGPTPLGRSVRYARRNWFEPIYNASKANPNPSSPLYDPLIDCRPYVLVVMTDGDDTCSSDPSDDVADLTAVSSTNPVSTYVLGMGNTSGLNVTELDQMAVAGGTGPKARLAQSQTEIEAAFADIVARTVKYEVCNGRDDNCNTRVDEGLNVYQECAASTDCGSNNCNAGRCACTSNTQCANGYMCAKDGFCRPSCSVGQAACKLDGVRKCGVAAGGCCVDDGSVTCTPLQPLPGSAEICNRQDDNCNGLVDENIPGGCPVCTPTPEVCNGIDDDCDGRTDKADSDLVGIGAECGRTEGECDPGKTDCQGGQIVCVGGDNGSAEICNGLDDDCDGVTDGMTQACYTGPAGTRNVGICHDGTQMCTAVKGSGRATWGTCQGQRTPETEICNGLDDNCDGVIDNVTIGGNKTGDACCPATLGDKCGVGQCTRGTFQCVGNQFICAGAGVPSDEICDHIDNDCDGTEDDVEGLGESCSPDQSDAGTACAGSKQCDYTTQRLRCQPKGTASPELCNGEDDDCDGSIDEHPDVLADPALSGECEPIPPVELCTKGHYECRGGTRVCVGYVAKGSEICNGLDDDCDGQVDLPSPCPDGSQCVSGKCASPCQSGEFPCPGGLVCVKGYCVPENTSGTGGAAGSSSTGGGSSGETGGTTGISGSGSGAETGMGASAGSGATTGGPSAGTNGEPGENGATTQSNYGLVTGGGGCACRVGKPEPRRGLGLLLSALALGVLYSRRERRAQKGGAA